MNKLFTNWTNEDFTWTWNNQPYTFKANSSVELEDAGVANHFAKHLAQRELLKANLPTDDTSIDSLIAKCFGGIEVEVKNLTPEPQKVEVDIIEDKAEEIIEEIKEELKEEPKKEVKKAPVKKAVKKNAKFEE